MWAVHHHHETLVALWYTSWLYNIKKSKSISTYYIILRYKFKRSIFRKKIIFPIFRSQYPHVGNRQTLWHFSHSIIWLACSCLSKNHHILGIFYCFMITSNVVDIFNNWIIAHFERRFGHVGNSSVSQDLGNMTTRY